VSAGLALAAIAASALGTARAARAAPDADLVAALAEAGGADVVAFELPAPAHAARVRAATTTRASAQEVTNVVGDPSHYGALVPALIRSQEVGRRGDARVVAWELEIPLFNLKGELELRARASGVELRFTDGDLSPGRIVFEIAPRAGGGATVEIDARLDVLHSSFFLRRVLTRSDYGEPGALAAAAWVALRAAVLRAEHPRDAAAYRPTAPPASQGTGRPDGRALLGAPFAPLAARGAAALVSLAPSGRLASVSVGAMARDAPAPAVARLADPRSWQAFPGWRHVDGVPATPPRVVVEDAIPFVDFDATWSLERGPGARWWTAVEGAGRGAWFGWQVSPSGPPTLAVLTMYPRLEALGSIPRRFIEAEPLLEPGMSLALVFVDAVGATRGGGR
jgi:hypothetical protein